MTENYFMILYSLKHTIMSMIPFLTKTYIIHLMEFYVNSITYFGWESNYLSIRPTRF